MSEQAARKQEAPKELVRSHQPGQARFRAILAEDIEWKPFAAFPPEARLAVLVGQPSEPGPYTIRVKVPRGVKLMPHRHPEDRIYTVISGVFYIGLGDHFEADKLEAYPPGAVLILPGNTSHFHWAKSGEYVTQVTAIGPLGLEYVNSNDDPRNVNSTAAPGSATKLLAERRRYHEHDNNERWESNLLQGLGERTTSGLQSWLAAKLRRLGCTNAVLFTARLSRHRPGPARTWALLPDR